jgi:hypothetical protein
MLWQRKELVPQPPACAKVEVAIADQPTRRIRARDFDPRNARVGVSEACAR